MSTINSIASCKQEGYAAEENYLDPWLDVVNVTACWRVPHAVWHRGTGIVFSNILRFIMEDIPQIYAPPVSPRIPNLLDGLPTAIANTLALVNSVLFFVGEASTLNFCRIFELAKFNAEARPSASTCK